MCLTSRPVCFLHGGDSASRCPPRQEQSRYPASAAHAKSFAWRSAPCIAGQQGRFSVLIRGVCPTICRWGSLSSRLCCELQGWTSCSPQHQVVVLGACFLNGALFACEALTYVGSLGPLHCRKPASSADSSAALPRCGCSVHADRRTSCWHNKRRRF